MQNELIFYKLITMKTTEYLTLLLIALFVLHSCKQPKNEQEQKGPGISVETYWIYDAERDFTSDELYMMENCGTCSEMKHFKPVNNPPDIPVLSDAYAKNDRCAEMYFPGCHYSTSENFCMKSMAQPGNQKQF